MANAHYHDCIEILHGQQGAYEARIGGGRYPFAAGDMVLIHAQEPHMVTAEGEGENRYLVLKFYPELLFSGEQSMGEMRYFNAFADGLRSHRLMFPSALLDVLGVLPLFCDLQSEHESKAFGYEIAVRILVCRIFLSILRHWNEQGVPVPGMAKRDTDVLRRLGKLMDYVECNYGSPVTLETAAKEIGMGYSAFSKFFCRHTGKSFVEYLTQTRLSKAKILLATTDKTVTEIALETGFSTTSYFIAQFRKENSITPRRFRERLTRS